MVLAAPMRASAVALQACSDFLRFAFNAPKGSNKRCQKALSIINATMRRGRAQRVGDRVRTYLTVQHSVTLGGLDALTMSATSPIGGTIASTQAVE